MTKETKAAEDLTYLVIVLQQSKSSRTSLMQLPKFGKYNRITPTDDHIK